MSCGQLDAGPAPRIRKQTVLSVIELYPQIKFVHVAAALASGSLFFLRAVVIQFGGAPLASAAPIRYLSYTIDTVLLTAALMLSSILHQYPMVHAWLTVKVGLILVYIVLGSFALKRGRTNRVRLVCWIAALFVFAMIVSIASTRHPLGALIYFDI